MISRTDVKASNCRNPYWSIAKTNIFYIPVYCLFVYSVSDDLKHNNKNQVKESLITAVHFKRKDFLEFNVYNNLINLHVMTIMEHINSIITPTCCCCDGSR